MTQSQHTPGKWVILRDKRAPYLIKAEYEDRGVFVSSSVCSLRTFKPSLELEANARLIAASPELLEALEVTLRTVDYVTYAPLVELIQKALNKATGEPND